MDPVSAVLVLLEGCLWFGTVNSDYNYRPPIPPEESVRISYVEFVEPSGKRSASNIEYELCNLLENPQFRSRGHLNVTNEILDAGQRRGILTIVSGTGFDPQPFESMHRCLYIYSDTADTADTADTQ